jgi:hypothetical protein
LFAGYFEGLDSERGIAWRAADSLTLRDILGLALNDAPPDHSTTPCAWHFGTRQLTLARGTAPGR